MGGKREVVVRKIGREEMVMRREVVKEVKKEEEGNRGLMVLG